MIERSANGDRRQPRHLLVGQMDGPVTILPTGRVAMAGARLHAGALYRLLPVPQQELAGRVHDLDTIWHGWTRRTADRIASAATPAAALDTLECALEELMLHATWEADARGLARAVQCLRLTSGAAPIEILAQQIGLGRRQFERRFLEYVGLSPRLFGRIVRFQRAFRALGAESGAAVAARCGYADQAHLVREVRRFAGQTPTLLAQAEGLTAFFRAED